MHAVAAHVRHGGFTWTQAVALEDALVAAEHEIADAIIAGDLDLAQQLADQHTVRVEALAGFPRPGFGSPTGSAVDNQLEEGASRYDGGAPEEQGGTVTAPDPVTAPNPDGSVIDRLQPFTWDNDEAVGYEVAIEAINEVVSAYSARIYAEQNGAVPDQAAIDHWRAERADWAHRITALDPAPAETTRVRAECRALLAQLRAA